VLGLSLRLFASGMAPVTEYCAREFQVESGFGWHGALEVFWQSHAARPTACTVERLSIFADVSLQQPVHDQPTGSR
jgi:hypothetical protein